VFGSRGRTHIWSKFGVIGTFRTGRTVGKMIRRGLVEVYPCKEFEVLRVYIRGYPRIIWRDRITKRFVRKHTIKITKVIECELYENIPRKRIKIHGFCTYWLDPDPEISIEEQVNEVISKLEDEVTMYIVEEGFGAVLEECELEERLRQDEEIEPDEYYMAGECECYVKWKHKPEQKWREARYTCRI